MREFDLTKEQAIFVQKNKTFATFQVNGEEKFIDFELYGKLTSLMILFGAIEECNDNNEIRIIR